MPGFPGMGLGKGDGKVVSDRGSLLPGTHGRQINSPESTVHILAPTCFHIQHYDQSLQKKLTFLSVRVLMNYHGGRDSIQEGPDPSVPKWERRAQQTRTLSPEEEGSGRAVPEAPFSFCYQGRALACPGLACPLSPHAFTLPSLQFSILSFPSD